MLQSQLQDRKDQLSTIKHQNGALNNQLTERSEDLEASQRELTAAHRELREKEEAIEEERRKGAADLEAERKRRKEFQERLQDEIDLSNRDRKKLKSKVKNFEDELDDYEVTVGTQKTEINKLETTVSQLRVLSEDLEPRQKRIEECEALIEKLVAKGDWHEAERRRLHNTIQVSQCIHVMLIHEGLAIS